MLAPFHYAFVQRGVLEALLLSTPAGILGTWIVLRGLAFFAHAVGTAAFRGLVLAAGLGWPGPAGAAVAATAYTFGVEGLASRRESDRETLTGLTLVGALALGVVLASDVFHSGANVETLLFGSLLLVGPHDVRLAAIAALLALALTAVLGRRWLATGFERETARSLGVRAALYDTVLLGAVAFAVVAALSAVGALLAAALYVVPAATTRLWFRRQAHRRRDDDADQRLGARRRRRRRRRAPDPAAEHRPARVRAAPEGRRGDGPREARPRERRRARPLDGEGRAPGGRAPAGRRPPRPCSHPPARRGP